MTKRTKQLALLAFLVVVLLFQLYRTNRSTPEIAPAVSRADDTFRPISVENPALRLDLLEKLKKLQYEGSHRNIFSASVPPPPAPARPAAPVAPLPPPVPVQPQVQPLTIPATFYGYVVDQLSGRRRAFFVAGEDQYIVGVGETLLGRFRLLQIGTSSVELEEIGSGRRATLTMEEPTPQ